MIYLGNGMVVIWFAGFIFHTLRGFNLGRLALNNLAPGESYRDSSDCLWRFGTRNLGASADPECLTEIGRRYRKRAIQNERIMYCWLLGGFILIACFFSYSGIS